MNSTTTFDPMSSENVADLPDIKRELQNCMDEWEQIKKRLDDDRREIEIIKHRTRDKLSRLERQVRQF